MALRQEHNAAYEMFLKPNLAWTLYFAGRYEEALRNHQGQRNGHARTLRQQFMRASARLEEARAFIADWLKKGPFSIATESCFAIKEPMKSAYLNDLRKAGLPER